MRYVVIDIESYFDQDYTFSKLSTEQYTRDKRFEVHGAGIKWSKDNAAIWYPERELRQVLKDEDWSDVFLISHHAHWDHLALSHHYDVHPKMSGCTLSMARLLLGNHIGVSLDSVRHHFGLAPKITPYKDFIGKHWHEMPLQVQQLIADGCCDECESIWKIFGLLMKEFPPEELLIVSETVKMFTEPVLRADSDLLARIWEKEAREKYARLSDLGIAASELQSSDRFAELLRAEGIEPETKEGKPNKDGSEKRNYCFAKTDPFMEGLLEHEDDRIRALAEARIGAKSTLLQTRAETLGWMHRRGNLCVYLRMYGAHTTRWSGGDGCLTSDTCVVVFDYQKGLTEKRIVDILPDDLIWDGEEFVAHRGVAFRGYKEVIEHDSIRGTPDHIVFTRKGEIPLATAKQRQAKIDIAKTPKEKQIHAARTRRSSIDGGG